MSLSPLLDALDLRRTTEAISIGALLQPTPLTGALASKLTVRLRTIMLVIAVAIFRAEKLLAVPTLASAQFGIHRAPNRTAKNRKANQKIRLRRRAKPKNEEELST